jgi:hypothetical protein
MNFKWEPGHKCTSNAFNRIRSLFSALHVHSGNPAKVGKSYRVMDDFRSRHLPF